MNLTNKQAECLTAIHDMTAERGYPPSLRELGAYLRVCESEAHYLVSKLRKGGYVEPANNRARRTRLTDKARALFREG